MTAVLPIDADDVQRAARRLEGVAHRTPVITSRRLDERTGARVALKPESLQRVGAFKFRGAFNAVAALEAPVRARGVLAGSSGNHAQALALAAALHDTRATIVMPHDAPAGKVAATAGYGARIERYDRYGQDRDALVAQLAQREGATPIPGFDHPDVMAGQGTAALELVQDTGGLDVLLAPVGGGGLLAGSATAVRALCPGARILGVEPEADADLSASLAAGEPTRQPIGRTIADGQQLGRPGLLTFPVIAQRADGAVTVSDAEIVEAMRFAFTTLKLVLEPSGACALAALLAGRVPVEPGERVGVILSGGNVDPDRFAQLLTAGAPREPAAV